MIFKDGLSTVILVANSIRQSLGSVKAQFEQQKKDGSHRIPGWEGEADVLLDEKLFIVDNAQEISIGATMPTAEAAMESLTWRRAVRCHGWAAPTFEDVRAPTRRYFR